MMMEEIQVAMDQLTKSQAMIAKQLGMVIVAIESEQGSTKPPATPAKPYEKPTPQESPTGVDEIPSDAAPLLDQHTNCLMNIHTTMPQDARPPPCASCTAR